MAKNSPALWYSYVWIIFFYLKMYAAWVVMTIWGDGGHSNLTHNLIGWNIHNMNVEVGQRTPLPIPLWLGMSASTHIWFLSLHVQTFAILLLDFLDVNTWQWSLIYHKTTANSVAKALRYWLQNFWSGGNSLRVMILANDVILVEKSCCAAWAEWWGLVVMVGANSVVGY